MKLCASCYAPFHADEDWKTLCLACFKRSKAAPIQRACADCGEAFTAKATWQTLCRDCYLDRKHDERQQLEAERDAALDLVAILRRELDAKQLELSIRPIERAVPLEQWRRLVQLCHPDRHGNSEAANQATRWLMEVRPEC